MFDNQDNFRPILYTVSEILKADNLAELNNLLSSANLTVEQTGHDNWNGGIDYFTLFVSLEVKVFVKVRDRIQQLETTLLQKFDIATRHIDHAQITSILIVPKAQQNIDWGKINGSTTKETLLKEVESLKNTMISVSTGGQRIQEVNDAYKVKFVAVDKALQKLNCKNPNPYQDLWEWYAKWSTTFSKYHERRLFITEMYDTLMRALTESPSQNSLNITVDLSDWERIERAINEIRVRQLDAKTEEQFQVIGLLSRETIITLAQAVFNKEKHPSTDGTDISKTDAKRMLEAYINVEFAGSSNETLRRYAKATLDLANELTHKRTASKKDASLCASATISIINLIGTIEGRI
ncbi:hypothetical protein [Mucilaginibacter sp.]|jgi:hypothetical protein|uniref:hypothetical protein n=1 Tax=Mucilaginibacter sp. TaxID=1882438 RepID=UPI002BEBAA1D|nr:hypothetical protein [Mucilaginibacter sp.]HTI60388.1 hypothetical protein [Mucilaginibacter sp.]